MMGNKQKLTAVEEQEMKEIADHAILKQRFSFAGGFSAKLEAA